MATDQALGSIAALWRFPVKSMQGEELERAELSIGGFAGDRAYGLIDVETGKVVSAKSVRLFPGLLRCRASFVEPPEPGVKTPPVAITLPDGTEVASDRRGADEALSRFFGRKVRLAQAAPADFTIDQYHPDIEGADPRGLRDTVVDAKLGAAFFAQIGAPSPVPASAFFDVFPLSVMTTSTLDRLGQLAPGSRFEARRFRMNVIVETAQPGFLENGWVGRRLALGGSAAVEITMPDPRCVMTTLAQDDLPADAGVLRALVAHNRVELGPLGAYPCAGAYAVVHAPGPLAVGDGVNLA